MNKTTDEIKNETYIPHESKKSKIYKMAERHANKEGALIIDLLVLTVSILFARCHLIFGAYPLALALVSAIPSYVPLALLGSVIGSLTMGEGGALYAIISAIAVLLRIVTSIGATDQNGEKQRLFSEGILLRMSVSVISGFVAAVYEVLILGFTASSIMFSLSMILLPPILVYVFSGIFETGFTIEKLISDKGGIFKLDGKDDKEKYNIIFFQCSVLVCLFLTSLSLNELTIFGINGAFIFAFFVTIIIAKRFGAPRAMATGFITALGVAKIYSVSFAFAGLVCGLVFPLGVGYSLLIGGAAASLWSIFAGGMEGFLTTLPEFAIAATLAAPLLKSITQESKETEIAKSEERASDMVGVFALSYRNKFSGSLDSLESSLASLSSVIRSYSSRAAEITEEDCISLILDAISDTCSDCSDTELCKKEEINPAKRNVSRLSEKLMKKEKILPEDINTSTEFCKDTTLLADEINMRFDLLSEDKYRASFIDSGADQYDLIGKLISEARGQDRLERAQDTPMSEVLTKSLSEMGYRDAVAKVFGERKKHFIIAMEDEGGERITSDEVKEKIEKLSGVKAGIPEFYRKDKMALMECEARRAFSVEFAIACCPGVDGEVSGDTATTFESRDDYFYALCSDGMGKGEEAKRTSDFVAKFLARALSFGGVKESVLHLLNNTVRSRGRECSVTVDLFQLDLIDGAATFIKSGAAPSFVKRDSSIFRIRSGTAPIGLMKGIDSEKIRVEVKGGDYVIMLSDGISQSAEESPWLLELLSKPPKETSRAYADYILDAAKERSKTKDDMSVIVLKIIKLS
jgi:stage II sporulation protein E